MSAPNRGASAGGRIGRALNAGVAIGIIVMASFGYAYVTEVADPRAEPILGPEAVMVLRVLGYAVAGAALLFLPRLRERVFRPLAVGASETEALQAYVRTASLTVGIADVPAVIGLVLAVVGGDRYDPIGLGVVSLVVLGMHFPRYDEWLAAARRGR
ncbi:MAG: hypothetical protein H6983_21050 [Ectothiorhodospiraceae bacterium]|nr:hypothetical protein [Ectothiorhodospiraceae bacterium]